jgi:hypothetical protein
MRADELIGANKSIRTNDCDCILQPGLPDIEEGTAPAANSKRPAGTFFLLLRSLGNDARLKELICFESRIKLAKRVKAQPDRTPDDPSRRHPPEILTDAAAFVCPKIMLFKL